MPIIFGTEEADSLRGSTGTDTIYGYGGNDTLGGSLGAQYDLIYGGEGDDSITGLGGRDSGFGGPGLFGENGNDTIVGVERDGYFSYVYGGNNNDVLSGLFVDGGTGDDQISSDGRFESRDFVFFQIFGDLGKDVITVDLNGNGLTNFPSQSSGVYGGDGNDSITVTAKKFGSSYGNVAIVYGGSGNDRIKTTKFDDYILGDDGRDKISSGAGNDVIEAGGENDRVEGGNGNDTITGEGGDDFLSGDAGNDTLRSGSGNDTIVGGLGRDRMFGDSGANVFVFRSAAEIGTYGGNDEIDDFVHLVDTIDLSNFEVDLTFINRAAFSANGTAQVRFNLDELTVEGDIDGNGTVDFALQIYAAGFNADDILV